MRTSDLSDFIVTADLVFWQVTLVTDVSKDPTALILTVKKSKKSTSVENGLSPPSTSVRYGRLQRVTIPDVVIIQFVLLKMSETC